MSLRFILIKDGIIKCPQYQHALNMELHKVCRAKETVMIMRLLKISFEILKSEFLYRQEFESVEQFKKKLKDYIEYCNHKRN